MRRAVCDSEGYMSRPVFITGLGAFLPGPPIKNDEVEEYLGKIGGKPSRARERVLKMNGIQTRHYALDKNQRSLYRASGMAAEAVREAIRRSEISLADIELIAAATTCADLLAPGFASMVHGELKNGSCEVASHQGICASGVMALKNAYAQIKAGEKRTAVACASEFPSRSLKASYFEDQDLLAPGKPMPYNVEFLRWMLSDGAGAAVLQDRPNCKAPSLRVEWVYIRSDAHRQPVCMMAGATRDHQGTVGSSWLDYPSPVQAARNGAFNLSQDVRMLDDVVKFGVDGLLELVEQGRVSPEHLDWLVCHYSSAIFLPKIFTHFEKSGLSIPKDRWFSNLSTKGNVGSASTYILLEELFNEGKARPGQRVLCIVPESGRFICAYLMLTVVSPEDCQTVQLSKPAPAPVLEPRAPSLQADGSPLLQKVIRELARVWIEFEGRLNEVPIVDRINRGMLRVEEYRKLLVHMRQQVIEGARWIARVGSNITIEHFPLRSIALEHAVAEHRHFQMLEHDFVSVGGKIDEMKAADKNIGSEALSAWMFHQASRENPFDLFGAMFIIEGLGVRMARRWGTAIRDQLGLTDSQVSFLLHHGEDDPTHFERLELALSSLRLEESLAEKIVRTARVTARLYLLQLEEIAEASLN